MNTVDNRNKSRFNTGDEEEEDEGGPVWTSSDFNLAISNARGYINTTTTTGNVNNVNNNAAS
jgi:hypothetical protein